MVFDWSFGHKIDVGNNCLKAVEMSFFKEAAQMLGLDYIKLATGYQIINYNGEAVYIEGAKRVISITTCLIALDTGKVELAIRGENLCVFDITGASIMIKGKIICVEILNRNLGENEKINNKNGAVQAVEK